MGWFLSPLIFDDVVSYIIKKLSDELPSDVEIVHGDIPQYRSAAPTQRLTRPHST
jgi:hypothetical protein